MRILSESKHIVKEIKSRTHQKNYPKNRRNMREEENMRFRKRLLMWRKEIADNR
jgi:hypothetical protein